MTAPLTARDLITMLHRHYIPDERRPGGVFAREIAAPGHTGRRADLIWAPVTAAGGRGRLIGHEIKTNRADLRAELADPTKSDPWQKFCDQWYLVVSDPALLDGLALPPTWGVLTPPAGRRTRSMTVHTPAPTLTPDNQAPATHTLMVWLHWQHHRIGAERDALTVRAKRLDEQCETLRELLPAEAGSGRGPLHEAAVRIVRALGGVTAEGRIGVWGDALDVDVVAEALRDLTSVQRHRDHMIAQYDNARAQVGWLQRQLADLLKQPLPDLGPKVAAGRARRPAGGG